MYFTIKKQTNKRIQPGTCSPGVTYNGLLPGTVWNMTFWIFRFVEVKVLLWYVPATFLESRKSGGNRAFFFQHVKFYICVFYMNSHLGLISLDSEQSTSPLLGSNFLIHKKRVLVRWSLRALSILRFRFLFFQMRTLSTSSVYFIYYWCSSEHFCKPLVASEVPTHCIFPKG